jgi:predicted porin
MDANWFNNLFDDKYDNVMNNVVQYVSNGFGGTSTGSGFGCSSGAGNDNNTNDDCRTSYPRGIAGDFSLCGLLELVRWSRHLVIY